MRKSIRLVQRKCREATVSRGTGAAAPWSVVFGLQFPFYVVPAVRLDVSHLNGAPHINILTPGVGLALGSVIHLKRQSGKVDSYVFDGTFRNLATGKRTQAGKDLGEFMLHDIIPPEDDPNFHARLAAFHDHLSAHGVTSLEEAPDDLVHAADVAAEQDYPYPEHSFDD